MSLYQAIANRVASPDARELARHLSSWHDRMVAHDRLTRALRQSLRRRMSARRIDRALARGAADPRGGRGRPHVSADHRRACSGLDREDAVQPDRSRSLAGSRHMNAACDTHPRKTERAARGRSRQPLASSAAPSRLAADAGTTRGPDSG